MKKLMTVLASAALAFGLYADDAVLKDGTSFESGEDGVSEGVFAPEATSVWDISGLSDPLEIGEYADGEELPYGTPEKNVRWDDKFKQYTDNFSYLTLDTGTEKLTRAMGTGNVVIDQIVKFSGFDEVQTNFVDGATKIAVWMSDIEKDGEANETNLYVTCGKLADGKVEPVAIKIAGDWELQKWYRLTIKSIGNIWPTTYADDERAGFVVYIDGNKVASDDAKTIVEDYSNLNGAAGKLYAQGQLFPAIDNTDTTFTSVSYAGTGAIDDIVADVKGPAFAIDTVAVTIPALDYATVKAVEGADEFDPETGIALVNPGKTITITWEAEDGFRLRKSSKDVLVGDEAMTVDVSDILADAFIVTIYDGESEVVSNCISVVETIGAVMDLEAQGLETIALEALDDIPAEEVQGFGTIGLESGAYVTITPVEKTWDFTGAAATLKTDILAGAKVTADADAVFTYEGEVAGVLMADEFGEDSALALAVGGQIITLNSELTEDDITVPQSYTLKATPGEDDLEEYTIYTAELVVTDYVAEIDGKQYETLAAAYEAAEAGNTITLLADCSGNGITIAKRLTIDFDGFIYTVNFDPAGSTGTKSQAFQILKEAGAVTFKNGTITSTDVVKMLVNNYTDLTLDGMTLDGTEMGIAHKKGTEIVVPNYTLSNNNGTTTLTGGTVITSKGAGHFAMDTYDSTSVSYPGVPTVVVNGATINGDVELTGGNLTLTDGTLNGALVATAIGEGVITKAAGFTAEAPAGYQWNKDTGVLEPIPPEPTDITVTVKKASGIASVTVNEEKLEFDANDEATFTVSADDPTATLTLAAESTIKIPVYTISEGEGSTGWQVTNKTPVVTADTVKANYFTFAAEEASTTDPAITDAAAATAIKEAAPAVANKVDELTAGGIGGKVLVNWIADKGDNDPATALAGDYVKASVNLDVAPITETTEIKIKDLSTGEAGALTFKIDVGTDPMETKAQLDAIKDMVKATSDVADWTTVDKQLEVTATANVDDGTVTVTPKETTDKAFMRVVVPKDTK